MDNLIGAMFYTLALSLSPNYLPSDGRCLPIKEFPELSTLLHTDNNWPYGRCLYNQGFRLPNTCDKNNKCAVIKVK